MSDQPVIVKKVRKRAHSEYTGSWKVAFADFMTAMMAFFMVMWIIGLDEETRSAIAGYFRDPLRPMKRQSGSRLESLMEKPALNPSAIPGAAESAFAPQSGERKQLEGVRRAIEQALSAPDLKELQKYVEVNATEEGLVLEFVEGVGSVFFETGSAKVRPKARRLFTVLGRVLANAGRNIVVDGHTDKRAYTPGSSYNNWNLSQDRARATLGVMMAAGVRDEHMLAVRGFADRRLRDPKNPYHFTNRRVTVLLPYRWKEEAVVGSSGSPKAADQGYITDPIDIVGQPNGPE